MRDCTKVARRITDFCFSDEQCHSFGAASFCGAPGDWGLRTCECDLEQAVWDAQRSMCRLFAGIGEACQVDSDCMAGELEIQCQLDGEGEGFCACPDGLEAVDGLCLTSGLEVGEECQITQECTGTANTECLGGLCTCGNGYQQVDDYCAPSLGGTCTANTDCIINNTVCASGATGLTCQCQESYVEYDAECWENSKGYNANCTIDAQCVAALGSSGACLNGVCLCGVNFHYRDGACWPMTGTFTSTVKQRGELRADDCQLT
ncbi:prion-like-(Q/N-rich) domain-bearing protein 25 [Choristoneura fumiferana]|uniref:prion-like-(Q/N-rich) domain-bearing protein 25 n=1 Tax=Choristoneura fumiferana TaxID=7141 RepID=UPI003D15F18D